MPLKLAVMLSENTFLAHKCCQHLSTNNLQAVTYICGLN